MNHDNLPTIAEPAPRYTAPHANVGPPVEAPPLSLVELGIKHRGLLLKCLALALLLGVIAQLLIPPTFESRAQIYVQKRTNDVALSPLLGPGLSAGQPSTQADLLKTTTVLKAALASPSVRDLDTIKKLGDRKLEELEKKIRVSFEREGETVTATYRSHSADDAATVLTAVVNAYLDVQRVDGAMLRKDGDAERALAPRGMMDEEMAAARLKELSLRQAEAEADAQVAAGLLSEAEASRDDVVKLSALVDRSGSDSQRLGGVELKYLTAELKKLEQQLESMPDAWGPEHAIRGPIQRQADALRYEVSTLSESVAAAMFAQLQSNYASAERRSQELTADVTGEQTAAAQMVRLPVSVIQWPEVPRKKVAPMAVQTLGIAIFAGLGLGLSLMLRRELAEKPADTVVSAAALTPPDAAVVTAAGYLDAPTAASDVSPAAPPRLLMSEHVEASTSEQGTPLLGQMHEIPGPGGVQAPDFNNPAASIHQIRAVLQIQATKTGLSSYAFTSPNRGSGKTSVALGVASSLALSGTKTLVVDCDLAGRMEKTGRPPAAEASSDEEFVRPGASPFLDMGLSDLTSAEMEPGRDRLDQLITAADAGAPLGVTGMIDGSSLDKCVIESSTPGLWLLPAISPRASHISKLSDAFIRRVIDDARGTYDLVLFDTGPIPGSVEALLVCSQADGVVVVVQQGESRRSLDRTMSYLKVVQAKVTGTVFNRVGGSSAPAKKAGSGAVSKPEEKPARGDDNAVLGSGILAAAVFSDAESDFASDDFELKETSGFDGELADVFGTVNGQPHGDPTSERSPDA